MGLRADFQHAQMALTCLRAATHSASSQARTHARPPPPRYGVAIEEDAAAKPACAACRRHTVSFSIEKVV